MLNIFNLITLDSQQKDSALHHNFLSSNMTMIKASFNILKKDLKVVYIIKIQLGLQLNLPPQTKFFVKPTTLKQGKRGNDQNGEKKEQSNYFGTNRERGALYKRTYPFSIQSK